mmetsp:Transcript_19075/g.34660  ORF Transcript_19075/g.34660 Transcript_19075/m.34660 type:complete len:376 (-) Transcript_19075:1542-2669(-)
MLKWKTICGIGFTTSCLRKNPQNFVAMSTAYLQRRLLHQYITRGRLADFDLSTYAEKCYLNNPVSEDKLDEYCRSKVDTLKNLYRVDPNSGCEEFLQKIDKSVASMLKIDLNTMNFVSDFFYSFGGKHFHSTAMLLLAKSLGDVMVSQGMFAEVIEMTHCASILHSLVGDNDQIRTSVQKLIGNNGVILGGDFMLSKASILCTEIGSMPLIQLLCIIIQNYTTGHFMTVKSLEPLERLKEICNLAYFKSVSMMANGCQGIGLLAGANQEACYQFGKHLGMAVYSISEALAYISKSVHVSSLPVGFALKKYSNIVDLIQKDEITKADILIGDGRGLDWTRKMAIHHLEKALEIARSISSECTELESLIAGLSAKLY